MNLFAVIGGALHTPELDGAILPGVTRDSLITLGRHLGYTVVERRMALDELLEQIDSGECSEVFACGTAAIVSPIGILADREPRQYVPRRVDAVAAHLREALLAIQERRAPDPFGWTPGRGDTCRVTRPRPGGGRCGAPHYGEAAARWDLAVLHHEIDLAQALDVEAFIIVLEPVS
ncbi:MAG: aminotransferase class IV [Steroidobacteraceae bacterium]